MTLDQLIAYGANVEEGLGRCVNNEGFYLMLAERIKDEEKFAQLPQALAARDSMAVFDAGHGIKGVTANLAITPILEPASELSDLVRYGKDADGKPVPKVLTDAEWARCAELVDLIEAEYERYCAL